MLKIKKFLKTISIISILLMLAVSNSYGATTSTTSNKYVKMEIVENNVCSMKINEYAEFEKKIVDYNLEDKELTIELKVQNTAEPVFDKPTEIFLVIDNSISMRDEVTADSNRLKVVTDSAKKFATELLKNENVKIGIVKFSTGEEEGTLSDATLLTTPTSDSTKVIDAISSIANENLGVRTNIDAGITVASQNFTPNCESKYLILLTDGVPNAVIGGPILTYSGEVANKTKNKLISLEETGIKLYSMMTGVQDVPEPTTGKTFQELAAEIFGTNEEPTVGKFYYIPDSEIEKTICETILKDISATTDSTLTDLKIYDYFPQEIVDNFDFSYVTKPTKGTISEDIDLQNNMIVWEIDKLAAGETATVSYKLKLKENVNDSVFDKIVNTNTKVEISANELTESIISFVSPKIKLTSIQSTVTVKYLEKGTNKSLADDTVINAKINEQYKTARKIIEGYKAADPEPTNKEGVFAGEPITVIYYYTKADSTTAKTDIPQTGDNNTILYIASLLTVVSVGFGIRSYRFNKRIK